MTTMPFGKHRGKRLADVPLSYLAWLLDECDVKPYLREAIAGELAGRLDLPRWSYHPPAGIDPYHLRKALGRWYREQVMRHHPDRGGEPAVMVAVNAINDSLHEIIM